MAKDSYSLMWNLYAEDITSICIQSTYGRLRDCLPRSIHIGKIVYFDHLKDGFATGSVFTPYMYKRHAFSHEHELRAVWFDQIRALHEQNPPEDHLEAVGLHDLIEKVFVRPTKEKWVRETTVEIVRAVAVKYQLNVQVEPSEIDLDPLRPSELA